MIHDVVTMETILLLPWQLFMFQEVQKRLEDAKAGIDKLDREKEEVYQQCEPTERQRVRALLQDLHTSWQEINENYTDRHR